MYDEEAKREDEEYDGKDTKDDDEGVSEEGDVELVDEM